MRIVKEICGACPQDIVIELDNGEYYNFYVRHGTARLYDEHGTELLVVRDIGGDVGILPYDEAESLIESMAAEYRGDMSSTCPHCGGAL